MPLTRAQVARAAASAAASTPLTPPTSPVSHPFTRSRRGNPVSPPIQRRGTVVEVTSSNTGLGTHVRWKRPYEEQLTPIDVEGGEEFEMDEDSSSASAAMVPPAALGRYTTPANQFFLQPVPGAPHKQRRVLSSDARAADPPKWNLSREGSILCESHTEGAGEYEDMGSMEEVIEPLTREPTFVIGHTGVDSSGNLRSPICLTSPEKPSGSYLKKALGPCGTELLDDGGRQMYVVDDQQKGRAGGGNQTLADLSNVTWRA